MSTSCKVDAWPKKITGTPKSDPGSPSTYYIGEVNGAFTVFAAHPENNKDVNETGTITIGPKSSDVFLSNLRGKKNENTGANLDSEHLVNQWTIQFSFHTFKSLDGLYFTASCGSTLSFSLKADNGTGTALKKPRPSRSTWGSRPRPRRPTPSPRPDSRGLSPPPIEERGPSKSTHRPHVAVCVSSGRSLVTVSVSGRFHNPCTRRVMG